MMTEGMGQLACLMRHLYNFLQSLLEKARNYQYMLRLTFLMIITVSLFFARLPHSSSKMKYPVLHIPYYSGIFL